MPSCGREPEIARCKTPEELQAALAEHRGPAPSRMLWLHASLLEEARRLWAMMSAELTSPQSPGH